MRLATYNVENLFTRVRALGFESHNVRREVLDTYALLIGLLEQDSYSEADKQQIVALLAKLGLEKKNESRYAILRENRKHLLKRSMIGGPKVVAGGRGEWLGWIELTTELVDETATRNTAQVVRDIGADVLAVCEAEGRAALMQFSNVLVPKVGGERYEHVMLIDGNDERGIDVGILSKREYPIVWMRSHVDDKDTRGGLIFSRDCAEYLVWTPAGERIWVLVNHFKSKGYGRQETSDARRKLQAQTVHDIYSRLRSEGEILIAVVGDLNDFPGSTPLEPLLAATDLKDASAHPAFASDGHAGTYANGTAREKIDYLLLSPAMFERVQAAGIWRKGVWGGKNGTLWDIYPEMQREEHAASDHAAIWCDIAA